jgi:hypothetical protein
MEEHQLLLRRINGHGKVHAIGRTMYYMDGSRRESLLLYCTVAAAHQVRTQVRKGRVNNMRKQNVGMNKEKAKDLAGLCWS